MQLVQMHPEAMMPLFVAVGKNLTANAIRERYSINYSDVGVNKRVQG